MTKRAKLCLLMITTLSNTFTGATQTFAIANTPMGRCRAEEAVQSVISVVSYSHPARDVLQRPCYGVAHRPFPYQCDRERQREPVGDQGKEGHTMGEFKLVIDRFEGAWAVVEYDGETFDMPRNLLPVTAKEGDTLTISLRIDPTETDERRKKIESLMDDLFL